MLQGWKGADQWGNTHCFYSTTLSDPVVNLKALCDLWFLKTCPIIHLVLNTDPGSKTCAAARGPSPVRQPQVHGESLLQQYGRQDNGLRTLPWSRDNDGP